MADYRQIVIFMQIFLPLFSFVYGLESHEFVDENHHYISDGCDWQGSKLLSTNGDGDSDRSVMPIYLRCSRGTIKWFYPTGGLRVVLKLGTDDKDFHGCIRIQRNTTRNARIYIQGKREMFQIFSANDGKHPDRFRCFVSVNHYIALFIEADASSMYPHDAVIFQYDLQQTPSPLSSLSPWLDYIDDESDQEPKQCQLCSDEEILKLYCSADFVMTGRISYYRLKPELNLNEFLIKPFYIHRLPINQTFYSDLDFEEPSFDDDDDIEKQQILTLSPIILNRPFKCKTTNIIDNPSNRYLFLGRLILGKYFMDCSVKLNHWKEISESAKQKGNIHCHI